MISIKYEVYRNDYNRRYADKSFQNMEEFKDWMFGLMNRPFADEHGKNMWFLDGVVKGQFPNVDSSSRITIRPEWGGDDYWIYCVLDNNKIVFSNGKYANGQCYISEGFKAFMQECMDRRDGKEQVFEFGEIEGYAPPVVKSVGERAAELAAQDPELARAVFYAVQRQIDREDIVGRIQKNSQYPDSEYTIEKFTDEDIDEIVDRLAEEISGDERYWQRHWEIADGCIEDVLGEKYKAIFRVSKEECDRIVDEALGTVRGVGVDMGSGCYDVNAFEFDGEKLNLYVDVCRMENEIGPYYAVYYAVEYYGGDNLFQDWAYTDHLDADELKKVVYEIANKDFSEDIRKELNKNRAPEGSLDGKIRDAENGRRAPSNGNRRSEREERQ